MDAQDILEKEYIDNQKKDQELRKKSIEDGEKLDKDIQKRMKAGEVGVSQGIDNHVGIIMFVTAVLFTLLALYFIFGVIPDRLVEK